MTPKRKPSASCNYPRVRGFAATFDEANLNPSAGLVPVMALARRAGLATRVATKLTVPGGAGCDAAAKVCSIVAGMLTGADSIDDLGVLREGAVHQATAAVLIDGWLRRPRDQGRRRLISIVDRKRT